MLQLSVKTTSLWDERNECFMQIKGCTVQLEHSLISISKWESIYEKPFPGLNNKPFDTEEFIQYIKCMIITPNTDPNLCYLLASNYADDIEKYMNRKMSATFFSDDKDKSKKSTKLITSELIYYWMTSSNIPIETEKWHINRLLMLINVCSEENKPPKKQNLNDIYARNRKLNEFNRRRFRSKG